MEEYNARTTRRGSFFGVCQRRASLFGFHWMENEEEPQASSSPAETKGHLQERYREMEHVSHQRRGSLFGHKHHAHPNEKGRRASMFGKSSEDHHDDHHRRGSLISSSNRRGSIGPMATLSQVTAKKTRRGSFFTRNNKVHIHEQNNEDLAFQVMAAFADFDV